MINENMIGSIIHHHNEAISSTELETIMGARVTPDATPVHVSTCGSHFCGSSAFRVPQHLSLSFSSPDNMDCVHKSIFMLCFKKDYLLIPHPHTTHIWFGIWSHEVERLRGLNCTSSCTHIMPNMPGWSCRGIPYFGLRKNRQTV